jgi:hypothetical protein
MTGTSCARSTPVQAGGSLSSAVLKTALTGSCTVTQVSRDGRIRQLPLALAIALRLHEAGAADPLIAIGLGIEPEGVPPVLELAKAKLRRLEDQVNGPTGPRHV